MRNTTVRHSLGRRGVSARTRAVHQVERLHFVNFTTTSPSEAGNVTEADLLFALFLVRLRHHDLRARLLELATRLTHVASIRHS